MSIKKGFAAIREANNSSTQQLKLKDGESTVIRFLQIPDEIISVWEYTIQANGQWHTVTALDKNEDPLYAAGHKASFKSYLVVLDKSDNRVKIFKASKTVGTQLMGLLEEYGSINDRDFKISRTGEKLKTTYQFFPRDREEMDLSQYESQIPDVEEMVRPQTRDSILSLMNGMDAITNTPAPVVEKKDEDFPF